MDKDTNIGRRPGGAERPHESGGARSGREDVASAEDGGGAATAPGRGPGPGFVVARGDSRDMLEEKIAILEANRPLARRRRRP
jgi:hypothetical protein